jgi:hypothetical protein
LTKSWYIELLTVVNPFSQIDAGSIGVQGESSGERYGILRSAVPWKFIYAGSLHGAQDVDHDGLRRSGWDCFGRG